METLKTKEDIINGLAASSNRIKAIQALMLDDYSTITKMYELKPHIEKEIKNLSNIVKFLNLQATEKATDILNQLSIEDKIKIFFGKKL